MAWGLYRLRHGHEGRRRIIDKHSGAGTVLCFVAATMIISVSVDYAYVRKFYIRYHGSDNTQWEWDNHSLIGGRNSLPVDPPENLFGYVRGHKLKLLSTVAS